MSALVVDSSSWVCYFRGLGSEIIESALEEGRVYLPPVVAAELLSGTMNRRHLAALRDLLERLPMCACDLHHWFRVGRLRAALRAKGVSVSTPDAHVAQCALDLAAELLTEDEVFRHMARKLPLRLAARG